MNATRPEGPGTGPLASYGQVSSEERFNPRTVTMEEAVGRQLDRIAYLRSNGQPWDEAIYQLRDMLVGLEDEEFFDGIPAKERASLKATMDGRTIEAIRRRWEREGWDRVPVRAFRTQSGGVVFRPTAENLSCQLRILMRLLARRGIAWRSRGISRLGPLGTSQRNGHSDDEAQDA